MNKYSKILGFTFFEMIMVILISGIIISGAISLLVKGVTEYRVGEKNIVLGMQANVALERITDDLHSLLYGGRSSALYGGNNTVIPIASETELRFIDTDKNIVGYKVVSNQLLRNDKILLDQVYQLNFYYYDSNGNEITNQIDDIRYIKISIDLLINDVISNFSTTVSLWNAN